MGNHEFRELPEHTPVSEDMESEGPNMETCENEEYWIINDPVRE